MVTFVEAEAGELVCGAGDGERGGRSDAVVVDCEHAACSGKDDDDKNALLLLLLL
jgi:hypothetical protein